MYFVKTNLDVFALIERTVPISFLHLAEGLLTLPLLLRESFLNFVQDLLVPLRYSSDFLVQIFH